MKIRKDGNIINLTLKNHEYYDDQGKLFGTTSTLFRLNYQKKQYITTYPYDEANMYEVIEGEFED